MSVHTGKGGRKVVRFTDYDYDPVNPDEGNSVLPQDYDWICEESKLKKVFQTLGRFWWKYALHARVMNPEVLEPYKGEGAFLFINHTQPFGDPFLPDVLLKNQKFYSICAPKNLQVPVLGPLLPSLGALPLPSTLDGMRKMRKAVHQRLEEGSWIVIYPEAHLWPWCTMIRPFVPGSFQYPVDENRICFCATVTYQKSKRRKPSVSVWLDGPYEPDPALKRPARRNDLNRRVHEAMENRARLNTQSYITYEKVE